MPGSEIQLPVSGPAGLNQFGVPAYCGTIWIDFFKAHLAASSREKHALAVALLYRHAAAMRPPIDVDQALLQPDLDAIDALLSSFLLTRQAVENDRAWPLAADFVFRFLREVTGSEALSLQRKLKFIEHQYGQLRPRKRSTSPSVRSIPSAVLEDLFAVVNPDSQKNPFRTAPNRWRNFTIFMLLLQLGLRKSELLILEVGSFRSQFDPELCDTRYWLDVATHAAPDPRAKAARLKNDLAVRQLPLSASLVACLDTYIANYRGDCSHAFLFASAEGNPLAASSLDSIFETLNDTLSATSKDVLKSKRIGKITPHSLRHTAAVLRLQRFVESGLHLEEAVQRMRPFFGWARSSDMPQHYARAFFDPLHAAVWEETFNDSLASLRGAFL